MIERWPQPTPQFEEEVNQVRQQGQEHNQKWNRTSGDGERYSRTRPQEALVQEALQWIGSRSSLYKGSHLGMDPEKGFDCSGFVTYLLDRIGFHLPESIRHCNEFFDEYGVLVHFGLQQSGDLVFFSHDAIRPTHMGIMVSETEYIHSPGKDNMAVSTAVLEEEIIVPRPGSHYDPIYRVNPIGFKRLAQQNGRWRTMF